MRRWSVFVAATLILTGCGSSVSRTVAHANPPDPSPLLAGRAHAEEVEIDAKEAREAHEQAAEAHKKAVAARRRHALEAAKERVREQEAREEAVSESHSYPPSVRASFVSECERTSGHEDATCECAIERIEAKVSYGRFEENDAEVRAGKPLPFIYGFEIGYCATSSAVSSE